MISPMFTRLNKYWRDEINPRINKLVDSAVPSFTLFRSAGGDIAFDAQNVISELNNIKEESVKFVFEPQKERWWATFGGKVSTANDIVEHFEENVTKKSLLGDSFEELFTDFSSALDKEKELRSQLENVMKGLQKNFEEQRAFLGKVLEPFKIIPVDFELFCKHFPFIISLAGSTMLIWPAQKKKVVRLTAEMIKEGGRESKVCLWFERRHKTALNHQVIRAAPYVLGALMIIWIFIASKQLSTLENQSPRIWWEMMVSFGVLTSSIFLNKHITSR
jgi:hypothetical protein